jgi:hypothetical protein
MRKRNFLGLITASLACSVVQGQADEPVLTLDGDIQGQHLVTLQSSDLSALPQISFKTKTPWTEGVARFSGPALSTVLEKFGAGSGTLRLTAVNNYKIDMARDMVLSGAPIIATELNGKPFSRRDKGPLWIVFPYDSKPEYRSELIYAVSVWQLIQITVLKD